MYILPYLHQKSTEKNILSYSYNVYTHKGSLEMQHLVAQTLSS